MTTDDTRAAHTMAGSPPTGTIVYDYETQLPVRDLAWSKGDQSTEPVTYKPNLVVRKPISPALLGLYGLVMVCSAAIGGYMVVGQHLTGRMSSAPATSSTEESLPWSFTELPPAPPPPVTVTAPPVTVTAPPTALPAPSTVPSSATGEQDATFLMLLTHEGFTIFNQEAVLANGHQVCVRLADGETLLAITDEIAAAPYTDFRPTWDQANSFTASAVTAYCPYAKTTR